MLLILVCLKIWIFSIESVFKYSFLQTCYNIGYQMVEKWLNYVSVSLDRRKLDYEETSIISIS